MMKFAWDNYGLSAHGPAKGIREWCKQDLGLQKKQGGSLHGHLQAFGLRTKMMMNLFKTVGLLLVIYIRPTTIYLRKISLFIPSKYDILVSKRQLLCMSERQLHVG